ncbi:MAG: slipin family protein [Verrucomicrobiaceae bacterium]|nr:MAG: slipin family protein [Verrucomicrobiaceae bacterium]
MASIPLTLPALIRGWSPSHRGQLATPRHVAITATSEPSLPTSMTSLEILLTLLAVGAVLIGLAAVCNRYRHEYIVHEGFAGLLYHEGKLVASLPPGRHVRWGRFYRLALTDIRKTLLQVAGQDVLTSDNVAVKVSVVLITQVVDVPLASRAADNYVAHLYNATQTALRSAVANVTMEALLENRGNIGAKLRELLIPQAEAAGVQIHAAEVRDVMLPGELRKAFSDVLKAKQEGLASLERARGESAALRNLANAARLIEGQPALATLRFLQTLSSGGMNQTIMMNDMSALLPSVWKRAGSTAASTSEGG